MKTTKTRRARRREVSINNGPLWNVDLDLYSREPLDLVEAALVRKVSVNYVGREGRQFSLHCSLLMSPIPSLDSAICAWVKLITRLPRPARMAWKRAQRRELNIGLGSQRQSDIYETKVKSGTLRSLAKLQATISVTLYPIKLTRQSGAPSNA